MRNHWKENLLSFLLFTIVIGIAIIKTINYKKLPKTGVKTEGIVNVGNRYITWQYKVKKNIYSVSISQADYPYVLTGEKYYVYYDIENPSNSIMKFTEPIIEPLLYDTVTSLPLTGSYNKGINLVNFSYIVGHDTIMRKQKCYFEKNTQLLNNTFTVFLRKDNTKIGYIKFN